MKLATFTHSGTTRVGVVDGSDVIDLSVAAPELPRDMLAFLEAGSSAMQTASAAVATGKRIPLAEVHLEAPIARPPKFLAIGLNYADHVAETGMDTPEHVMIFSSSNPWLQPSVPTFLSRNRQET